MRDDRYSTMSASTAWDDRDLAAGRPAGSRRVSVATLGAKRATRTCGVCTLSVMSPEGPTPFENETATELLTRLVGLPAEEVRMQLDDVLSVVESAPGEEIELADGQALVAVATIAVVRCGDGMPDEVVPDDVVDEIRALEIDLEELADLVDRLPGLLVAVADPAVSELARSWEDAGAGDDWRDVIDQLVEAITERD